VGRLDDIIDRNQHPSRHRKMRFPLGLMLSAFVLLILVLIIFTDSVIQKSPEPATTPTTPSTSGAKRVDGVLLYRAHARDAGAAD
jgi:hypothetical protein